MCKALDDWYQDGVNEGLEQLERFRRLCIRLSESGRKKELERVLRDEKYCEELYQRYRL